MRAGDVSQTALARLAADACDVVAARNGVPQLVWLHARGMYGPWDAPLELQESLLDEGDPPPVEDGCAARFRDCRRRRSGHGVSIRRRLRCASHGSRRVLGSTAPCRGSGRAGMTSGSSCCWACAVFRWASIGAWAASTGGLYADQLHVPWMVRFPDGAGRLGRRRAIGVAARLVADARGVDCVAARSAESGAATGGACCRWCGRRANDGVIVVVCERIGDERAIRTAEWSLRLRNRRRMASELFVRPDDRWEANDVAATLSRGGGRFSRLSAETFAARLRAGEPA